MKVVRIQSPEEFDSIMEDWNDAPQPKFVYLFGTEEPETGKSWCPDCVIADPKVRNWVKTVPGSILFECPVGNRTAYKNNPGHPYRVHPLIKLKAIPTLLKWENGPVKALVEHECNEEQKRAAFLSSS